MVVGCRRAAHGVSGCLSPRTLPTGLTSTQLCTSVQISDIFDKTLNMTALHILSEMTVSFFTDLDFQRMSQTTFFFQKYWLQARKLMIKYWYRILFRIWVKKRCWLSWDVEVHVIAGRVDEAIIRKFLQRRAKMECSVAFRQPHKWRNIHLISLPVALTPREIAEAWTPSSLNGCAVMKWIILRWRGGKWAYWSFAATVFAAAAYAEAEVCPCPMGTFWAWPGPDG